LEQPESFVASGTLLSIEMMMLCYKYGSTAIYGRRDLVGVDKCGV